MYSPLRGAGNTGFAAVISPLPVDWPARSAGPIGRAGGRGEGGAQASGFHCPQGVHIC